MTLQEKPLRYGEGGRGFAMVTLPECSTNAPIIILLNAGLLHRAEPYRLNVLAARRLATIGYICVRVDLSGKGDTPPREGLTNRESVAIDWRLLCEALERQWGPHPLLIMGLCSGADNGIKLSAQDTRVRGLILLDPRSPRDRGYLVRHVLSRALDWRRWIRLPSTLLRSLRPRPAGQEPNLGLRDLPRPDDLEQCLKNMVDNDGRLLMIFTSDATPHYNRVGQFVRATDIPGLESICREYHWPDVEHIYPVEAHRERLLTLIDAWGKEQLSHLRAPAR